MSYVLQLEKHLKPRLPILIVSKVHLNRTQIIVDSTYRGVPKDQRVGSTSSQTVNNLDAQGESQPLAFHKHDLLNPLTQQVLFFISGGARANEEENTHSCLQIGGTMRRGSRSVIQGPWFRGCGGFIQHQRLGMIPFQKWESGVLTRYQNSPG
ncbi:hypothetical protein Tco_0587474 [Tanacetum coccineum]